MRLKDIYHNITDSSLRSYCPDGVRESDITAPGRDMTVSSVKNPAQVSPTGMLRDIVLAE